MNERIRELLVEAKEQTKEGKWYAPTSVWAEKFAELVIEHEREACAKVCDEEGLLWGQRYAAAIRARGRTGMSKQTEAERLADAIRTHEHHPQYRLYEKAAAELRRLVSFNQQLMDEVARLQKREWVGLTDEEIAELKNLPGADRERTATEMAFAVQNKLKEKNH